MERSLATFFDGFLVSALRSRVEMDNGPMNILLVMSLFVAYIASCMARVVTSGLYFVISWLLFHIFSIITSAVVVFLAIGYWQQQQLIIRLFACLFYLHYIYFGFLTVKVAPSYTYAVTSLALSLLLPLIPIILMKRLSNTVANKIKDGSLIM